ncbi:Rho-binding antiterminator [Marinobacterium arenosum]|uniref:Rho-binding antiterminator n=1 Tax=Marinobacterium arenosum TaxID=2862496 RepID=UPI001C985244|nr:Rho-binding antiterminator [Marinobacterium arenosum]MBY4678508.1 Rho-binding antiterminator [Marinobacterium arenosum]
MNPYEPINCEVHDGFELACIRNAIIELSWREGDAHRHQQVRFLDLENSKEGEFLIAENRQGDRLRIRLDMITSQLPY